MKQIYINKLNEWNIFTYIVIIRHDNISTFDLYTGNFYVACLDYLYRNETVSVEIYCYDYFHLFFISNVRYSGEKFPDYLIL